MDNKLYVLGDLDHGFFESFERILFDHSEIEHVILGSGGGSVSDAIKAGLLVRQLDISTTLSENCYSACPLVFIGGVKRTIWSPYPKLGFHQIYKRDGESINFDAPIYKLVAQYAELMGIESAFLISVMQSASPQNMNEPDLELLCKSSIATWVQRLCSSRN